MRLFKCICLISIIFIFSVSSCRKALSNEDSKLNGKDSIPPIFPFAAGFCSGVTLGIPIVDTNKYVPSSIEALPDSVLLDMPPAGNQLSQGSCTSWATVYAAGSYYQHFHKGRAYSELGNLSAKFTYNQIAKGNCTCTGFLDNLYLLKTEGASELGVMPYDPNECLKQPDSAQRKNALAFHIQDWRDVDVRNLDMIKRAVYEHNPVLFAIHVDDGFGVLKSPFLWKERIGKTEAGHALVIVGYSESKKAFRIMNSWGQLWGDNGFAWIDYDFFKANAEDGGFILI